jgi:hypothetical protein
MPFKGELNRPEGDSGNCQGEESNACSRRSEDLG